VQQAQARVSSSRQQIAVLNQQLLQNQLQALQSKEDAAGRVQQAEADLAAAQSDLAQQNASLQLAEFDREAYTRLAKSGAVSERQGKEAVSKADAQAAAVAASKRRVEAAQGAVVLAKSSLSNPAIRNAQTAAVQSQILEQKTEVINAESQLQQANAQLVEAAANRSDLSIRAPFEGSIVTRTAEPGEVIAAGTAIVTMLDLRKVYLRGFVPEGQIGKVKVGQPARVYLDSAPKSPLDAYVSRIDPQATFTPENTYFRDDRVKQVVGVKLQLKSGIGFAKPGMPSDGEILVQGDNWPRHIKRQ
jgi:HlyD family secretion protein